MKKYYLAVDIGASSGRHMLGWLENGRLYTEEIHRFPNGMARKNGRLCWNLDALFEEIKTGLSKCGKAGKIPSYMGIDTWGVDFVLLDESGAVLGDTVGYRDSRTDGMDRIVESAVLPEELYRRTGIQKQPFNSVYQLMAIKKENPEYLEKAADFLLVPDYLNYLLTGEKVSEYTNATTTNLVNARSRDWDWELIRKLGYPERIFREIQKPGMILGNLKDEVKNEIEFDLQVVLPGTHDTASAVLAVPGDGNSVYLSSGTWSLMGVERLSPDCSEESRAANYTNEGGYQYRYRYLKNIMGLWMLQSVRKEWNGKYSFEELAQLAEKNRGFPSRVEVNDRSFLSPNSMIRAVQEYCAASGQRVPGTVREVAAVIYRSLAESYRQTVEELERLTGRKYREIHIVGGGCRDGYLNRLTAETTGRAVFAGPVEATAIGNLAAQMLGTGEAASPAEIKEIIGHSFDIVKYE